MQETNVYGGLAVALPFIHSRPRYFARGHRRAAVLDRAGQDPVRLGLRDLDAEVAGREVLGLSDPGGHRAGDAASQLTRRDQGEDPRPQRRPALRHRRRGAEGRIGAAGGYSISPPLARGVSRWRPRSMTTAQAEVWAAAADGDRSRTRRAGHRHGLRRGRGGCGQRGVAHRLPPADLLVLPPTSPS